MRLAAVQINLILLLLMQTISLEKHSRADFGFKYSISPLNESHTSMLMFLETLIKIMKHSRVTK